MDRNSIGSVNFRACIVALRKESVDRNLLLRVLPFSAVGSLSARRAWIEISYGALDGASEIVALRKESVDRNFGIQAD